MSSILSAGTRKTGGLLCVICKPSWRSLNVNANDISGNRFYSIIFPQSRRMKNWIAMSLGFSGTKQPVRHLNLHEYQSKTLMDKYGVDTQRFSVVDNASDAKKQASNLNVSQYVVKAQIHAGGRGKGVFSSGLRSGVHVVSSTEEVKSLAEKMLGYNLITKQTPPEGVPVHKLMIAEALDISRETYFAILMDRESGGPVMVGSPKGGMDIESVAEAHPELIFKEVLPALHPTEKTLSTSDRAQIAKQTLRLAHHLGFNGHQASLAALQMQKLYDMLLAVDATQIEINPLGETPDGRIVCFDAKITFDENAMFRQSWLEQQVDRAEEDPREREAHRFALNYVGMDGNIGCMVNGAGLAMATMDIIYLHGGRPANFLDVGGGASEQQVKEALRILMADTNVRVVLVNIFGGIMKCDTIAQGLVTGVRELKCDLPIVVRLQGTNVEKARKILTDSRLPIDMIDNLDTAADRAVSLLSSRQSKQLSA